MDRVTVLTIEDDPLIREGLVAFLEDRDYRMIEAENGEIGLTRFRAERPDIVLTDLNMPVLDGLGVLAALQAESPETPVIVISGTGDIHYAVQALKLGAWDYLMKPVLDMTTVEHAINRALEKFQLRQDNAHYKRAMERLNADLCNSLDMVTADQEAGYRVQSGLLPKPHLEQGAWVLDVFFLPALYLSGDFVDYQIIHENQVIFYMADVSGHGVSSAFGTVLLKSLMSQWYGSFFQQHDTTILDPALLLQKLGEAFRRIDLGKYLTMFYGIVDREKRTLTYSVGGQYPNPILRDATGVRYLSGRGFPIGVFPKAVYDNQICHLSGDFDLFCFSDGILEIFPDTPLDQKEEILLAACRVPDPHIQSMASQWDLIDRKSRPDDITLFQIRGSCL